VQAVRAKAVLMNTAMRGNVEQFTLAIFTQPSVLVTAYITDGTSKHRPTITDPSYASAVVV